jgi:hypothetical protein
VVNVSMEVPILRLPSNDKCVYLAVAQQRQACLPCGCPATTGVFTLRLPSNDKCVYLAVASVVLIYVGGRPSKPQGLSRLEECPYIEVTLLFKTSQSELR